MNDYYTQDNHGPFEVLNIGCLELEDGGVIPECKLAIAVHGALNADGTNAILVPTWYSGTSKIMEQVYIGEGRALDPAKYCIIIVNQIGNGLSTSPSNIGGPLAGPGFPKVRISDDVRAQHRLLTKHLGIERLALVFGGSMGAQQTYEWAVRFPDFVERAAPMAGTARNTEHDFQFTETLIEAITSDLNYQSGNYIDRAKLSEGLKRHAKLWTVMGWSTEFFRHGRYKSLGFESMQDFVDQFMTQYFASMDPNNLLAMAWKWQRGDVSRNTNGDLKQALNGIKAKTYVMPISHDMFFTCEDCLAEQQMIPNSEFRPLRSVDGHLGLFGTDAEMIKQVDINLRHLLSSVL
ncbi:MAG: alpha/beta fold hydrolase [Gammaproteobacteria bacterium]|nr:alpha/beta fold hydrolase [Gammaproteobacteria bacterium]MBU0801618.1 alpha/beta fold hydrolase [Alphaproteobacteria bacterium]